MPGEALELWEHAGLDFDELAWDLASEVRLVRGLNDEIGRLETRIDVLYGKADPAGIVISTPGVGPILAGGILGRLGDANRFANLAGVRSFSGMVPKVNQTGHTETRPGITKQGDAGLRRDIWFAADVARQTDPQLAAKYHRRTQTASLLGDLPPGHHPVNPHRCLLAKKRTLRHPRHRRPAHHRHRRQSHRLSPLPDPTRNPQPCPHPTRNERISAIGSQPVAAPTLTRSHPP
jgi:hypothetical protein